MITPLFKATRTVSTVVADAAGHPAAQLLVMAACIIWWLAGGSETSLSSAMSIGAFVLTQMVLNQQRRRERALHLKIDELILAKTGARDIDRLLRGCDSRLRLLNLRAAGAHLAGGVDSGDGNVLLRLRRGCL